MAIKLSDLRSEASYKTVKLSGGVEVKARRLSYADRAALRLAYPEPVPPLRPNPTAPHLAKVADRNSPDFLARVDAWEASQRVLESAASIDYETQAGDKFDAAGYRADADKASPADRSAKYQTRAKWCRDTLDELSVALSEADLKTLALVASGREDEVYGAAYVGWGDEVREELRQSGATPDMVRRVDEAMRAVEARHGWGEAPKGAGEGRGGMSPYGPAAATEPAAGATGGVEPDQADTGG